MVGGGNGARLASEIERAIGDGGGGLLSFGMAGGLEPGLPPGTIIVASLVVSGGERFVTTHSWSTRLRAMLPGSLERVIVGVDAPVASRKAKACLYASTGAAAADMESHVAARCSTRAGLPFAVLRVIADSAERTLPAAALAGMGSDGRIAVGAVARSLLNNPAEAATLLGVAAQARGAMAQLVSARRRLGPQFGLPLPDPGGRGGP